MAHNIIRRFQDASNPYLVEMERLRAEVERLRSVVREAAELAWDDPDAALELRRKARRLLDVE